MINIVPFDKNKIDKELDNNIYKFLNNNIKETIFNILGFSFFRKNILYSDLVGLFHDTHNNEPKLLIAYISSENEKKLNKIIFIYLLKNIHKVLLKPSYFFSLLTNPRTLKYDSNTTQLLTLIIESSYYKGKIDLSSRDKIIDNFHYKYVWRSPAGLSSISVAKSFPATATARCFPDRRSRIPGWCRMSSTGSERAMSSATCCASHRSSRGRRCRR